MCGAEEQWNQVEFGKIEPRWIFPHLWHSLKRQVGEEEVHFMFIDTEALRLQLHNYTVMMEWLEEELATSTAHWKIVAGAYNEQPCNIIQQAADYNQI